MLRLLLGRHVAQPARTLHCVQIELTNHCTYRCTFCPQSQWRRSDLSGTPYGRAKGFMDLDLFRRVVDQANEIAEFINFSFFGEPMMHPRFLKFMDYLKNRNPGLGVVMNTNLSLATRAIFDKLIEIDLTELRISIDAASEHTYNQVRPGRRFVDLDGAAGAGNRFETLCQKAEYWLDRADHTPTKHVFTVNSMNVADVEPFVRRWLGRLGTDDSILTKLVLTYGGKVADTMIRENPCNIWTDNNILTVDWTGCVSPCNLDVNMDLAIGSVQKSALLELHHGEKRKHIERLSKEKQRAPCKKCVDANNWSRNVVFRKGDHWNDRCLEMYNDL